MVEKLTDYLRTQYFQLKNIPRKNNTPHKIKL